jgi:hypothetical protein
LKKIRKKVDFFGIRGCFNLEFHPLWLDHFLDSCGGKGLIVGPNFKAGLDRE